MKKNLLLASVLFLTLGFSMTVMGKQFQKLESFSKLPQDKQTLVVETMETVHTENRELRQQAKEIKQAMKGVLTAPEFDANAYQSYADKLQGLKIQMMVAKTGAIKDLASQMNQQEREVLLEIMPKGKKGHGKHHGERSGDRTIQ
jgi:uncharacterized membrane protein